MLPPQAEPAFLLSFTFRNRNECRRSRFRREQVVAGFVQLALLHVVADREQSSPFVNKRFKTHLTAQAFAKRHDTLKSRVQLFQFSRDAIKSF